MSEPEVIERDAIAVELVRVRDAPDGIARAWEELESRVALRGRHFFGAFDPAIDEYRACVEVRDGDPPSGFEAGTLPGGHYLRLRLHGEPPGVYERIPAAFDELVAAAGDSADPTRPSLEHYRRRDEIDLLLPVL
jgi:hypothetical protein